MNAAEQEALRVCRAVKGFNGRRVCWCMRMDVRGHACIVVDNARFDATTVAAGDTWEAVLEQLVTLLGASYPARRAS